MVFRVAGFGAADGCLVGDGAFNARVGGGVARGGATEVAAVGGRGAAGAFFSAG
ncbi:MAG: hypothetical protein R3A47_01785 [Polyangiales bacterium]